jgi:PPP family 3-phenylpropionic acid transporter
MTTPPRPTPIALYIGMAFQYSIGGAFLPFATIHLRDRGLTYDEVGAIFLLSAATGTMTPFLLGIIADRWVPLGRLLRWIYVGSAACLVAFNLAGSFWGLCAAMAAVFALYQPAASLYHAMAYHVLAVPEVGFGRLRMCGSIGWMVPSLPIYLAMALAPGRTLELDFVMYLAAGFAVATAAVTYFLPAVHAEHGTAVGGLVPRLSYREGLRALLARRGFSLLVLAIFLAHSSFAVVFYYSPPYLEAAGFERRWIGPLQCIGVAVELPFLYFVLPRCIRRWGYLGTICIGSALLLARHLLYVAPSPPWVLAWSYVLVGGCVAFYLTTMSIALNSMADRSVRATAQAIFAVAGPGFGQMAGHQAVRWIAAEAPGGLRAGFAAAAATAGAALVIFCSLRGGALFPAARREPLAVGSP